MAIGPLEPKHLEAICRVLADTEDGLTGSEIANLLHRLNIDDPSPEATKRVRLFEALSRRQARDQSGNLTAAFIKEAMSPVRYSQTQHLFEERRRDLNAVLSFAGYAVRADGEITLAPTATTLSDAQTRASSLQSKLQRWDIHPDVVRFCKAELLQDNYFHAVLEATKSVADKLRQKSGVSADGIRLVDAALGGQSPVVAINSLATESHRMEQQGFGSLLKGMFGVFRNPTAHAPRITWVLQEQDALDLLSLASYAHRRLDAAVRVP